MISISPCGKRCVLVRFLVATWLLLPGFGKAANCPDKLPFGFSADTVASKTEVNGIQSEVLMVSSPKRLDEALKSVQEAWEKDHHRVYQSHFGIWNILSVVTNECITTLQLADHNGAAGFYTYGRPAKQGRSRDLASVLPAGMSVASVVKSEDAGRRGVTTIGYSNKEPKVVVDAFLQSFNADGWKDLRVSSIPSKNGRTPDYKISAQKKGLLAEALVFGSMSSQIVVNVYELN